MLALIIALQAAAPDIELNAHVRAKSVTIEKQGDASLTVRTDPEGANLVDVRAPKANGRKRLRNVEATVRAEARIAEPAGVQNNPDQAETPSPQ